MIKITFIDFFAGVGGFRKGLELAGHKCLGFCEYDKYAVQSYRAIHETEGEWYARDIREVRAADIPRADMWCAGFPCQDVSICGKQLGFKGKRSSLFFTVTSLVADLEEKDRPSMLFFENVKNLLSVNRGFDFARLLIELDKIGYDAQWSLINSADVVPQNRERVFIIASIRGRGRPKVFPIGKGDEIYNQIVKCINPRNGYKQTQQQDRIYDINGHMTSLSAQQNGRFNIAIPYQQEVIGGLYSNVSERFQRGILPDCSRALKAHKHDACVAIKTATKAGFELARVNRDSINLAFPDSKTRRGRVGKDKAQTLDTYCNQGIAKSDIQIRKLTPLECWRLQGWSDEDFFKAFFLDKELGIRFNRIYQKHKKNPVRLMQWAFKHQKMSDSQLYKQAGNGVTVTVIQRIGERIEGGQRE